MKLHHTFLFQCLVAGAMLATETVVVSFSTVSFSQRISPTTIRTKILRRNSERRGTNTNTNVEEAKRLLEKSRALREEIAVQEKARPIKKETNDKQQKQPALKSNNKWALPPLSEEEKLNEDAIFVDYRLYVDIGREPGTWMEPRWGASGRRIEFTLDVRFTNQLAAPEVAQKMVQDNQGGKSSPIFVLQTAPLARLRSGFDEMGCGDSGDDNINSGAFRIDKSTAGKSDAVRFFVPVKGISDSTYGDVSIPEGELYFSIPCFGSVTKLSSKGEMPVTIRQMGWKTGWRRMESRILGIFKAVPIEQARRKDGF